MVQPSELTLQSGSVMVQSGPVMVQSDPGLLYVLQWYSIEKLLSPVLIWYQHMY